MEKYFYFDRSKTLTELESEDWGEPDFDSHLVVTCHELRKKPLSRFSNEYLRIMIGQKFSLDYLIPLALEILEDDILAEGNYYCGDLLDSVLKVNKQFWVNNLIYKDELERILEDTIKDLESKRSSFQQGLIDA